MQWGDAIQAEFFPIEVTKSGTPRTNRHQWNPADWQTQHFLP